MAAEKVKDLQKDLQSVWSKIKKEAGAAFDEAFAEFFTSVPEAEAIAWTQYTPYWCDGDICTFGVNEFSLLLTPDGALSLLDDNRTAADNEDSLKEYSEGMDEYGISRSKKARSREVHKLFQELLKNIRVDDLLQVAYGDHAAIVVNRDGTTKNTECEHG